MRLRPNSDLVAEIDAMIDASEKRFDLFKQHSRDNINLMRTETELVERLHQLRARLNNEASGWRPGDADDFEKDDPDA